MEILKFESNLQSKDGYSFKGYASKFNGLDVYGDQVSPGAFSETLTDRERPVQLRWMHDRGPVIGKFTKILEDNVGLYVEAELSKGHSVADDAAALLKHGAISGLSIGYIARESQPLENGGRLLQKIDLVEISLVEEPADNLARITDVKSALQSADSLKEVEKVLREHTGLSRKEASLVVSRVGRIKKQCKTEKKHNDEEILKQLNKLNSLFQR